MFLLVCFCNLEWLLSFFRTANVQRVKHVATYIGRRLILKRSQWGRLVDITQHQRCFSSQSPEVWLRSSCELEPNLAMCLTDSILWEQPQRVESADLKGNKVTGRTFYHGHILWFLGPTALPVPLLLSTSCSYQSYVKLFTWIKLWATYFATSVSRNTCKHLGGTRNLDNWNN